MLLLLVARPLPRDGSMAEDHGAPEAGKRSKCFEMQEVREIGRKEAGESRDFPILWMGIMEDVFQMEGKECEDQERLKM